MATQARNLYEKANGIRGGIRNTGIKRGMGGNLDAWHASQGQEWGVNAQPESRFDRLQREGFSWKNDLIPGMAGRQARNEAEQGKAANATATVTLSTREMEVLTAMKDGILALLQ